MAERYSSHVGPGGAGVSKPRGGIAGPSVRRNLFQSQLVPRPTAGSSTSAETLRLDPGPQSETSDIVVRDKNGEVELGDPPTPIDEADEPPLDARHDNEERQRLAEAVKQHHVDQSIVPSQPQELLEAIRASLRAKVAALAEDGWMFEREEAPRYH